MQQCHLQSHTLIQCSVSPRLQSHAAVSPVITYSSLCHSGYNHIQQCHPAITYSALCHPGYNHIQQCHPSITYSVLCHPGYNHIQQYHPAITYSAQCHPSYYHIQQCHPTITYPDTLPSVTQVTSTYNSVTLQSHTLIHCPVSPKLQAHTAASPYSCIQQCHPYNRS